MSDTLLQRVQFFLEAASRGESSGIPPHLIHDFKEMCGSAIERQFSRNDTGPKIRMSGVGKPLCQQKMGMRDDIKEDVDYTLVMKFLFGDIIEAIAVTVMKAAGINVEDEQKPVQLEIGGTTLKGTYDIKIDGKIYDIKSASPGAFSMKFAANRGYNNVKADDVFGYVPQGYPYSEAAGCEFGGWIAINKATGEWAVCKAPLLQQEDRAEALKKSHDNIVEVLSDNPFKKSFSDTEEIYKDRKTKETKKTGNRLMNKNCGYCGYREYCWPKSVYKPKAISRAENKPRVWYTKYVKETIE